VNTAVLAYNVGDLAGGTNGYVASMPFVQILSNG
jgi:hypothetical protein